jgi:hypothetical protein
MRFGRSVLVWLVIGGLVVSGPGCVSARYKGPQTEHFDGRRFQNPGVNTDKSFVDLIKWQWTSQKAKWQTGFNQR